jgi:hypothetical protein
VPDGVVTVKAWGIQTDKILAKLSKPGESKQIRFWPLRDWLRLVKRWIMSIRSVSSCRMISTTTTCWSGTECFCCIT